MEPVNFEWYEEAIKETNSFLARSGFHKINDIISETQKRTRQEIREEIEGFKKGKIICDCYEMDDGGCGCKVDDHNSALDAVLHSKAMRD